MVKRDKADMGILRHIYYKYLKDGWPDKGSEHSYIEFYELLLYDFRETAKNMVEIGIFSGQSYLMWEEYFEGKVYGVDCSETPLDMMDLRPLIAEGKNIVIMDAASKEQVKEKFSNTLFDVIIEDASHSLQQQLDIYAAWKDKLAPGGIYIIEDVADIDNSRATFENIDPERKVEIVDRRNIKNRFDDVLILIRNQRP